MHTNPSVKRMSVLIAAEVKLSSVNLTDVSGCTAFDRWRHMVQNATILLSRFIRRVVHGTYLSVPSYSNLCLSHPMGFLLHYYNINMEHNSVKIIRFMKVYVQYLLNRTTCTKRHAKLQNLLTLKFRSIVWVWQFSNILTLSFYLWVSWEIQMCAVPSHPMGHFPWDSHRNDIPMDKPGYTAWRKPLLGNYSY